MRPFPSLRHRLARTLDRAADALPAALLRAPRNEAGTPLSPLAHWLLQLHKWRRGPALTELTPQQARQRLRRDLLPLLRGFPVHERRHLDIDGAAGALPARLYRPAPASVLPALLLYFHGGGFVLGDLDTHDDVCRLLCREAGLAVLSVAYRLAPEHPFPAAADDAEAATRWAQDHAADFGIASRAIAVGDDSAGGNLAAVVAQALSREERPPLAQLLVYPATDHATARASHARYGEDFFLSAADRAWFYRHYLDGDDALGAHPRVSPLLTENPGALPPALVVTAGFDMLRDEGKAYAAHLRAHGTDVETICVGNQGHGFINMASFQREAEQATRHIARRFRTLCDRALLRAPQKGGDRRSVTQA